MTNQRLVIGILLAALLILSGCIGAESGGDTTTMVDNCAMDLPNSPSRLTNETAVAFAMEYQRILTYNRICSKDQFHLDGTTARSGATVEFATEDARYVFARQAFSYSTDQSSGDGSYSSVYWVSEGSFSRVRHYGAEQHRLDTYSGPSTEESVEHPLQFRLYNLAPEPRTISIKLTYQNDSQPALKYRDRLDGNKGIRLTEVATRSGTYSLLIKMHGENTRYTFDVSDPTQNTVAIYIPPKGHPVVGKVNDDQTFT